MGEYDVRDVLTLRFATLDGAESLEFSFKRSDGETLNGATKFTSPVIAEHLRDARWLFEDYPLVRGRASTAIAERIQGRLNTLGGELFRRVFLSSEEGKAVATAAFDEPNLFSRLHIRIQDAPSESWIPWELMRAPHADKPLALAAASFARFLVAQGVASAVPSATTETDDRPIRILLIISRPRGEDDVPFRSVASRVVHSLNTAARVRAKIDVLRPPTFDALEEVLTAAAERGTPYDVVHFDGHGVYRDSAYKPIQKRGYIVFEQADSAKQTGEELSGSPLGKLLFETRVRLLFLNACRSAFAEPRKVPGLKAAPALSERAFSSLAHEVLAEGVPAVVAMGFNVHVATAAQIVAEAYTALASGHSVGEALTHARTRRAQDDRSRIAFPLDWSVPITFEAEPIRLTSQPVVSADDGSAAKTYESTLPNVAEMEPTALARAPEYGFIGYDELILRLDRSVQRAAITILMGVAGSGKTAIAGEFGRWIRVTTERLVAFVDMLDYPTLADAKSAIEKESKRIAAIGGEAEVQDAAAGAVDHDSRLRSVLWVFDNTHVIEALQWAMTERSALTAMIRELATADSRVLVTTRCEITELADVPTIVIEELDMNSRFDLAERVLDSRGSGDVKDSALRPWLEWSGGIPGVILGILTKFTPAELSETALAQSLLRELRAGSNEMRQRCEPLLTNLSQTRPPAIIEAPIFHGEVVRMYLFQRVCTQFAWDTFAKLAELNGIPANMIESGDEAHRRRFAALTGLSVTIEKQWTLLHPFGPMFVRREIERIWESELGPMTNQRGGLLLYATYIQVVSILTRTEHTMNIGRKGAFAGIPLEWQNLCSALDLAILHRMWQLALPLVTVARAMLLAEQREDEWRVLWRRAYDDFINSPMPEHDIGLDDPVYNFMVLLADEATRVGELEQAEKMRLKCLERARTNRFTMEIIKP